MQPKKKVVVVRLKPFGMNVEIHLPVSRGLDLDWIAKWGLLTLVWFAAAVAAML